MPAPFRSLIFAAKAWCCSGTCSGGTWTAYDVPPSLVHGVALIRAAQPNICVYGHAGRLRLQVGPDQYALSENSPRIKCTRGWASFGCAAASPSNRAPAACCSATPTGPIRGRIFSAGSRPGRKTRIGAPRRAAMDGGRAGGRCCARARSRPERGHPVRITPARAARGPSGRPLPHRSDCAIRPAPSVPRWMLMMRTRCSRRAL